MIKPAMIDPRFSGIAWIINPWKIATTMTMGSRSEKAFFRSERNSDRDAFKKGTDIPFAQMKNVFDYTSTYVEEAAGVAADQATTIMKDDKSIDSIVGMAYDSCCWSIQLLAQRRLQNSTTVNNSYDNSILVQFVFKGLGSLSGSKARSTLTQSIYGYTDPFQ